MKQILSNLLLLIFISNTTVGQSHSSAFTIKGTLSNLKNGTKIYLGRSDNDEIDSTTIEKEAFFFKGQIKEPQESIIVIESLRNIQNRQKRKIFWIENGIIKVQGSGRNLEEAIITGSKANLDYEIYEAEVSKKRTSNFDSLSTALEMSYINKNPGSYRSAVSLYFYRKSITLEQVKFFYSKFPFQIKNSRYG